MGELRHILVHVATPVEYVEGSGADEWIEGEPGETGPEPVKRSTFPCILFLPLGQEEAGGGESPRGRKVSRPTIMFEAARPLDWDEDAGASIELSADDELLILAPELAGHFAQAKDEPAGTGRWQIDGRPQPFGPPGSVIGVQAVLKQVTD